MKTFITTLFLLVLLFSKAQTETYDDGTQLKYRLMLVPIEFSAEWITASKHWSSRLSFGISPNVYYSKFFSGEPSAESFASINPRIGLDLRKYFNPQNHDSFYGYFMEVGGRYYFPLVDFDGYLRLAYQVGCTWKVGENGFVTAAIGAAFFKQSYDKRWGIGPSGSFGIGIDLN